MKTDKRSLILYPLHADPLHDARSDWSAGDGDGPRGFGIPSMFTSDGTFNATLLEAVTSVDVLLVGGGGGGGCDRGLAAAAAAVAE